VLLTGGYGPAYRRLSSAELYGSTCIVPDLPKPRNLHFTFLTPDNAVATCGGYTDRYSHGCLVLRPGSGWEEGVLGSLGGARHTSAVITLPGAAFVLGGSNSAASGTSEVLLKGEDAWRDGPELPIDMYSGCAVKISELQFLAISDKNIVEFDTSVAGPLNTAGWRPAGTWPDLLTGRNYHSCAATAGLVVVAGGSGGGYLKTTEIINLSTRTVTLGPKMLEARSYFQLAVLPAPGGARVVALGGRARATSHQRLDTVEEWVPGPGGASVWRQLAPLEEGRSDYGAVVLPADLVCPP
jgi:hypothetical protein